ncbi:hypothetical protein F4678DRAFT_452053 [Xylaria arbuscula]|nr:hypothetical protein F4678DRAFT_452053 [Xylaria arbuscula]
MNPTTLPFHPRRRQDIPSGVPHGKPQDSRSQVICKFYQSGTCRNGHNCSYRHQDTGAPSVNSISQSSAVQEYEPRPEEQLTRTLSGALARFEEGAAITEVIFTTDLSAVQLTGLPRDSTHTTVLDLIRSRELDTTPVSDVRIIHSKTSSSARVEATDPNFLEVVMSRFGRQTTSQQISEVTAAVVPVESFASSDSNTLRVDCKKVHCSWHKPSKTVWLNFGDEKVARRVSEKFGRGEYNILNQTVRPGNLTRDAGHYNARAWTVCLADVPSEATKSDVSNAFKSQRDVPRNIELGKPNYTSDSDVCAAEIQSLFTHIGPLEWWEFTLDTTGKRMKASARFAKEEDAKNAAEALNNFPLPFHTTAKLTVQLVYCARFKVSSLIYDAVERQIKDNISRWKTQHLHFTAYEQSQPPKWYRTVKIEGEDGKSVAGAKKVISSILAGTVAKNGSSSLWQPSVRSKGEISDKLAQLQRQTGVVILPNKAKAEIRLFGPPKQCKDVEAILYKILTDESSNSYPIELDEDTLRWACLGGYETLAAELGPESIRFDIAATPKRFVVTGTVAKYDDAMSMINGKTRQTSQPKLNEQDCPACLTEAENPIRTRCGHSYCLDCFENLCLSAPTQDSAVKIHCVGDSGHCNTVLDLPQLQEHLSSTAFEELLEQSFASYARLHPNILRYCPSPDCDYVYRVGGTVDGAGKIQTCSSCLVAICTSCHAQHGTMSCADYRDISSGGREANERLKKEIGIKDCPKCKTPLEKIDGCNHMACRCGAHICWVCLRVFGLSDDCYSHMRKEHGDIGLGHYQEMYG